MAAAMSSSPFTLTTFLCLYCFLVVCVHFPSASSLNFSLDFSKTGDPCGRELICKRDATFRGTMIELTRNDGAQASTFSRGLVWYATPVPLWNAVTAEVASFTTTFYFEITWMMGSRAWADGMAFFLSRYSRDDSVLEGDDGGLLGLFQEHNYEHVTGDSRVVAVEFDTAFNPNWDKSNQHVGIDVNSITSVSYTNTSSPDNNLTSGFTMIATVRYNNGSKLLAVDLQIDDTLYHINATVDLKKELPEEVAVGFSAGTGDSYELHRVLSWSFNSTLEAAKKVAQTTPPAPVSQTTPPAPASQSLPAPAVVKPEPSQKLLMKVLIPVASVSVFAIVCLLLWLWWKLRRTDEPKGMVTIGPRRYAYHELAAATDNFAEGNKLGQGGFGSVYKGRLLTDGQQVAIKRFSSESSSQGRREFEAEVKIISRLRHRNLVQLLGWCDDSHKGLLLVYELVPEGSLDKHIHDNPRLLTWSQRYNIILGLGSALRYLHLEWEQCVVHGDIKPNNIMLDSSYNTKLGDFGLARLVDHGSDPITTALLQGTMGYVDPEFLNTSRRSAESDVYSFGMVLLEIISSREPVDRRDPSSSFVLQKWVWSLYSQGATLDAADPRLMRTCDDDAGERLMERALVVGLWCAHPDPAERPSSAQAMQALQSEDARLPELSAHKYKIESTATPDFAVAESGGFVGYIPSGVGSSATT